MKPLTTTLFMLMLCLSKGIFAQTAHKPALFSNQPDRLICSAQSLANAFTASEGDPVNFNFSNNTNFSGRVLSNITKYSNLQSMTIQLNGYDNAVFHLSKQINEDRTVSFVGRIMHKDASDGFMIEQDGTGYAFKKINTERILELCH